MSPNQESIEVTRGSRTAQVSDLGRFRVSEVFFPPDYHLPSHYHDRACVSVIVEGYFIENFGGETFDCPPSTLIAKPPGERHEDLWLSAPTRHLVLEPDPEAHEELGAGRPLVETIRHTRDPRAGSLARRMLGELRHGDVFSALALEALGLELLVRMQRLEPDGGEGEAPPWLLRVRDLLHEHHGKALRIGVLAEEAGVHPSHLSRSFADHFGTNPGAYLRRVRLEAAKRDLRGTDLPISRIAIRHGFADQSHLTRLLRRDTGMTPAVFRKSHSP